MPCSRLFAARRFPDRDRPIKGPGSAGKDEPARIEAPGQGIHDRASHGLIGQGGKIKNWPDKGVPVRRSERPRKQK